MNNPISKFQRACAWASTAVSAALLLMSALGKIMQPPAALEAFAKYGYAPSLMPGIGALELLCTILYLLPRTSILGALLLTAYLGGAVSTHVRVHEPFAVPLLLGVAVWAGVWLRDPRLRELLPFRSRP